MKKGIIYLVMIIMCCLVVTYFVINHVEIKDANSEVKDRNIVYSVNDIKEDLKSISNFNLHDNNVICATSRGLLAKDSEGNITCDLADSYEVKDNGIEYTFKIKDDCYFSDGTKITAKDFVEFFRDISDCENDKNIEALLNIFGISDYGNKKIDFENTGITCENDTLRIRLNKPNNNFIDELTKVQYKLRKSLNLWSNIVQNNKKIICSGEYSIDYADNDQIIIHKNKYSNSQNNIDSLIFKRDESSEFAMADYQVGKRDIVEEPPKDYLLLLNDKGELCINNSNKVMVTEFNDSLPVNERCGIYTLLYKSITDYTNKNMYYIEPSECSYTIEEKNNINNIQNRKVFMNNTKNKLSDIKSVSILAEDNPENRYWIEYFKGYLKDEYSINVNYYLATCDEIKDNELKKRYDVYMYCTDYFISKDNRTDVLFSNCISRTLFFYYKNIAISNNLSDFKLDFYGDFIFEQMKKD